MAPSAQLYLHYWSFTKATGKLSPKGQTLDSYMANSNNFGSTHWMEDMQFQPQMKIPFPYPVAWSHDLIHPQLLSPKCILLSPKKADQEAGGRHGWEKRLCWEVPLGGDICQIDHVKMRTRPGWDVEGNKQWYEKLFPVFLILRESCFQMRPFINFLLGDRKAPWPRAQCRSSNTNSI